MTPETNHPVRVLFLKTATALHRLRSVSDQGMLSRSPVICCQTTADPSAAAPFTPPAVCLYGGATLDEPRLYHALFNWMCLIIRPFFRMSMGFFHFVKKYTVRNRDFCAVQKMQYVCEFLPKTRLYSGFAAFWPPCVRQNFPWAFGVLYDSKIFYFAAKIPCVCTPILHKMYRSVLSRPTGKRSTLGRPAGNESVLSLPPRGRWIAAGKTKRGCKALCGGHLWETWQAA